MPTEAVPTPASTPLDIAGHTATLRVAVIIGSVREGRFGPTVASWFATLAGQRSDTDIDVVDLAEFTLPLEFDSASANQETASQLEARLAAADAFVVVTPEYNHSYPAVLKNAIDWHVKQWHAKPVGFVSYGGLSGGLRAVEHLRLVFAEVHAVTIRDTVSFHAAWNWFDADGRPSDPQGAASAATTLLERLTWWARALRDARATTPYTA